MLISPLFTIVSQSQTNKDLKIEKFSTLCDRIPIIKCYENKLFYNCSYPTEVEKIIRQISDRITDPPWWLDLID